MLIELFLHGVPKGQDIWGVNDDLVYIQNFYTSRNDKIRFLIQMRDVKGKRYCYYSYLKYNNIVDSSGRPGAYLGITIRMDAYCADVVNIYNILDAVYKRYFVGSYLSEEMQKTKYLISDFQSKDKENKEIFDVIMSLFKTLLVPSDFIGLQSFATSNSTSIMEANILDCTKENVLTVLKDTGAIALSPYYSLVRDKSFQKNLEEQIAIIQKTKDEDLKKLKTLYERQIAVSNLEREKSEKEKNDIKECLQDVKKENDKLITDNKRLQAECDKQRKAQDAINIVESLRDPLIKLSNLLKLDSSFEKHNRKKQKTKLDCIVKAILPIINSILLLMIVLWLFFRVSNDRIITEVEEDANQVNTVLQEYAVQGEKRTEKITLEAETEKVFIDTLTMGESYKLKLNIPNRGKCKWKASEVADIQVQNDSACTIYVNKKDVEEVVIYIADETDNPVANRKFKLRNNYE